MVKGERSLMLEVNYQIIQQKKNGYSDRRLAIEIVEIVKRYLADGRLKP